MMNGARMKIYLRLLGAAFLALSAEASAATAGLVQFAIGDVQIVAPDNQARPAVKGNAVNEGDTIITGANSAAHLRMADDGVIALKADSRIRIDTFRWQGKEDGTESSIVALAKGGFRAITGVIGRRDKNTYVVRTPTATIGIRGTDHEPLYIPPPEPGETPPGPPGTYNKVNIGDTFILSAAGRVELGANEVGFASLQPNVAPVKLDRVPDFMRTARAPLGKPDRRNIREAAAVDAQQVPDAGAARAGRDEPRHALPQRFSNLPTKTEGDFDASAQTGGFRLAPVGLGMVGGLLFRDSGLRAESGAIIIDGTRGTGILEDPSNNPSIVSNSGGFRYARRTAPMVDSGRALVDGVPVNWGVYAGGVQFVPSLGASETFFFYFMQALQLTSVAALQQPGSATYSSVVGFTRPIDEMRRVGGSINSFSASITFGANPRLTSYNVNLSDAGARVWTGTLTDSQGLGSFARSGGPANLTTTCSGACAPSGAGETTGFVIGANRGGLLSAYRLQTSGGANFVTGSIVAKPP